MSICTIAFVFLHPTPNIETFSHCYGRPCCSHTELCEYSNTAFSHREKTFLTQPSIYRFSLRDFGRIALFRISTLIKFRLSGAPLVTTQHWI